MNIKKRMIAGFGILIGLATMVSIISIFTINSLDFYLDLTSEAKTAGLIAKILTYSSLVLIISLGIAIAVPTVTRITRFTNNLQNVLKVGTDASINVSNIATELAASASEVNAGSEEISSTIIKIVGTTQEVMKSSNKINNIMSIITNISDQTNLLALNASIEAGRAGEYGRGFAIVADEVRKLATISKKSVSNTSIEINEIINKIFESNNSIESISAASEQQTASIEEISSTTNKLGVLAEDLKNKLKQSELISNPEKTHQTRKRRRD